MVLTVNDTNSSLYVTVFQKLIQNPRETVKSLGSGGSIVARPKLKGIDGKTPPGVEFAA